MKKIVTILAIYSCFQNVANSQMSNPFKRFWSGFFAPVYMTATNLEVELIDPTKPKQEKIIIPRGTFYSVVYQEKDTMFFEITSRLREKDKDLSRRKFELMPSYRKFKEMNATPSRKTYNETIIKDTTYQIPYGLFALKNPKPVNHIFQQGVTIGSLFLPIKIRPSIERDGIEYKREFSTDFSAGPFIGYKYHIGDYYAQYVKFGLFAGPTLIKLTSGNTAPTEKDNTNVLGLSIGGGLVGEFKKFQAGFIFGWDYLSGESAKAWIYDKKLWFSIGIGFNFFQDKE